jgi:hypothetical protein
VEDKETYAIVSALEKWSGWIGLQPVLILTDHKTLESWHKRAMDTPSGMTGRRARWHEKLSRFDLTVVHIPGVDNVVADAMSRWAYPASQGYGDVSIHGSEEEDAVMEKIIAAERAQERACCVVHIHNVREALEEGLRTKPWSDLKREIRVITRSGREVASEDLEDPEPEDAVPLPVAGPEIPPPPPIAPGPPPPPPVRLAAPPGLSGLPGGGPLLFKFRGPLTESEREARKRGRKWATENAVHPMVNVDAPARPSGASAVLPPPAIGQAPNPRPARPHQRVPRKGILDEEWAEA